MWVLELVPKKCVHKLLSELQIGTIKWLPFCKESLLSQADSGEDVLDIMRL